MDDNTFGVYLFSILAVLLSMIIVFTGTYELRLIDTCSQEFSASLPICSSR
jgi:hypothetical protein